MRNFYVSETVELMKGYLNVGIAPGKFDTKQLILSALAVLANAFDDTCVRFIRSVDRAQLAKCNVFINDDFTTMFPVIPSYHDIEKTWNQIGAQILKAYHVHDEKEVEYIGKSVKTKICNLESIDCLMEMYEVLNQKSDCFEDALRITINLISKFIKDSIDEVQFFHTMKDAIEHTQEKYVTLPFYIQGWRNTVLHLNAQEKIEYAIFPEGNSAYLIEAFDKEFVMKRFVKGMPGVIYSGRFFVKVTDLETAKKVLNKLPSNYARIKSAYA